MKRDSVTINQGIFMVLLFMFGSSVIMGVNTIVVQDTWIAMLLGALIALPLLLMYGQILSRFPGKDLFEIAEITLGKKFGLLVTLAVTWYALHLAALVLRDFSDFVHITLLAETPQLPILLLMILTSVYLTRSGVRAIGKWSVAIILFVFSVVIFTFAAALRLIQLDDILPFMEHPPQKILYAGAQIASFPYAESVLFLCLGGAFPKGQPKRIYVTALLISTVIFLLTFLRNVTLLGPKMYEVNFYPSYVTARIIQLGNFLTRIEGSISSNFLMTGIVKISVCLTAAAKGISRLCNLPDYKTMAMPAGMFVFMLSLMLYDNTMDVFHFLDYYLIYAVPFQVLIPLLIFFVAEVEARRSRKSLRQGG
ncbi:MAG: endospore germination permease [Clostridiales bacterium]|nr:endospore germination permease [Clostridiales bacterium]